MAGRRAERLWGPPSLCLACGAALLAAGCGGGSFTQPMYDTIYPGQPNSAVRAKLGQPNQTLPDAWIYFRRRPLQSAAILFERGRVAGKLWSFEKILTARDVAAYRASQQAKAKPKAKSKANRAPPSPIR